MLIAALIFGAFAALASLIVQVLASGILSPDATAFLILGAAAEEILIFLFVARALSFTSRAGSPLAVAPLFALGFTLVEVATFFLFFDATVAELPRFAFIACVHLVSAFLYAAIIRFPRLSLRLVALLGGILIHVTYNLTLAPFLR